MSIKGNEAQGVSVIITSDKDIETLNKLADEFQKYPVSSQRSTAGLYALLEISGNLKREKDGFTFLTPNGIVRHKRTHITSKKEETPVATTGAIMKNLCAICLVSKAK